MKAWNLLDEWNKLKKEDRIGIFVELSVRMEDDKNLKSLLEVNKKGVDLKLIRDIIEETDYMDCLERYNSDYGLKVKSI